MKESEAKGFIQGKLDCMKKCGVFNKEDNINYNDCDYCNYCYSQGTFGQQKEAFNMAINALEKQIKKENADGCVGCAFEDVEELEMPCKKCKRACKDYWRAKE